MKFSDAGLQLLKQFEGLRLTTYFDMAGLSTIGYGHRLGLGEWFPNSITEAEAETLLSADVVGCEEIIDRLVRVSLSQGQFDALVDFVFNLGGGRLAGSTLLRKLNEGDYGGAAAQLLLWDHVGKAEIAGLKARRAAEFAVWMNETEAA